MEERERMETVPMGNGSKEELFEKGHPVIRELKSIPEIIFEEQIGMLPSSAIPVKSLFARKQMDHFHVDSLILKKIALQVLHILKKLSQKHIYPGLIELQEFYVDMDNSQYGVVLLHPEKFQLLTFEIIQSYSTIFFQKNGNRFLKTERYAAMKNCRIC